MFKNLKYVVGLSVLFILFSTSLVFAEEETTLLPEGQAVSISIDSADPRGMLIASRVARITNNEDGTLSVSGQIIAHEILDYAYICLYLDRYDEDHDEWINLSFKEAEFTLEEMGEEFMGFPLASYTLTGPDVEPGYYYRVRGTYLAKKEGRRESGNAETNGVLLTDVK